jgi:hypothetical protein
MLFGCCYNDATHSESDELRTAAYTGHVYHRYEMLTRVREMPKRGMVVGGIRRFVRGRDNGVPTGFHFDKKGC